MVPECGREVSALTPALQSAFPVKSFAALRITAVRAGLAFGIGVARRSLALRNIEC